MYDLVIRRGAERDIEALPVAVQTRVIAAIFALRENPRPARIKKLTPPGGYRIRVGDYRVVLEINDATRVVTVTRVKHRRDVYHGR